MFSVCSSLMRGRLCAIVVEGLCLPSMAADYDWLSMKCDVAVKNSSRDVSRTDENRRDHERRFVVDKESSIVSKAL